MAIIPDFLIKRVYKKGSLKETEDGIMFELKNVIGPGVISGLSSIQINDHIFPKEAIKFKTQNAMLSALMVSEECPIHFRLGQEGTILLEKAQCLKDGFNKIVIELTNPQAGAITVILSDEIRLT